MDKQIPLPSHIHYELLMQLLERQTLETVYSDARLRSHINELIITLRKALSKQRQLEEELQRANLTIDYRWSLNDSPASLEDR